tara:strand:- start:338 stop:592 length:255 start_codon:yes stop_codon:yes gene_type:complete
MRSPLYYKKHGCGQIMSSHRRTNTSWYMSSRGNPYRINGKSGETTRWIEHYCPSCDIVINEVTDSEWRPEGDKLDLGTCCGGCK